MKTLEYNKVPLHYINYILKLPVGNTEGDYASTGKKIRLSLVQYTFDESIWDCVDYPELTHSDLFNWNNVFEIKLVGNPFYYEGCDNYQELEIIPDGPSLINAPADPNPKSGGAKMPEVSDISDPSEVTDLGRSGVIEIYSILNKIGQTIGFEFDGCNLVAYYTKSVDNVLLENVTLYNGSRNKFKPTKRINDLLTIVGLGNIIREMGDPEIVYNIESDPEFFMKFVELTYKPGLGMMGMKKLSDAELIKNFDYSKVIEVFCDPESEPFEYPVDQKTINLWDQSIPYTQKWLDYNYTYPKFHYNSGKSGGFVTLATQSEQHNVAHPLWNDFCNSWTGNDYQYAILAEIARTGHITMTPGDEYTTQEDILGLKQATVLRICQNSDVLINPYLECDTCGIIFIANEMGLTFPGASV